MLYVLSAVAAVFSQAPALAFIFYTGPESILPIASGLAAVIGVLLMLWQRLVSLIFRLFSRWQQKPARSSGRQS